MVLNQKKIAFITCVNDVKEYSECKYYLDRLRIPEGYQIDIISIEEAPSMAAGYNAGMRSTDAKYKVYLHQDVFINNIDLIVNLLTVFAYDKQIGLLGMIGNKNQGLQDIMSVMRWDTGKVVSNEKVWDLGKPVKDEVFAEVQVTDGLLMATQYDIPWREDLFDGWDFYDISQCMEFRKAGYKVAVPWQKYAWCYHDDLYVKKMNYYDYYCSFVCEYAKMIGIYDIEKSIDIVIGEEMKKTALVEDVLREEVEKLFAIGDKLTLRILFQDSNIKGQMFLREYESIVCIDYQEEEKWENRRFWKEGMTVIQLISKLRNLKYMLKRLEYTDEEPQEDLLRGEYSVYAIIDVCSRYIVYRDTVLSKLGEYLFGHFRLNLKE